LAPSLARSSFLKLPSARARASFGLVANVVSFFGEAAEAFCGGARQFNRARRVCPLLFMFAHKNLKPMRIAK
jgi:hypothetical protein